jgi:myosin heavy subunit
MAETTNVWVRTTALQKAVTGKAAKEIRRGLPTAEEDEVVDWGWAYATLKQQNQTFLEIYIQDEESPHHGMTVKVPPDSLSNGDVLPGNKFRNDEDFDGGGEEEAKNYPDDLIVLTHLHEAEVVHCLRKRYTYDKIYTSTGPILLALNPFKNCKQLYSKKVMEEYWACGELVSKGITNEENPLPPHVLQIVRSAL